MDRTFQNEPDAPLIRNQAMPRPREFEPEEVVEKAMKLFWRKGYGATSIQDLVDETGVNRASLYATFGDKHSLFLRALARYTRSVVPSRAGILERPDSSLPQIREYFATLACDLSGPDHYLGCLMVNSAVELAVDDPEVAETVTDHLARLETAFAGALGRAVERGEIPEPSDVPALARFLMGAAQGLMVVGKANPDPRLLGDIVDGALRAVG